MWYVIGLAIVALAAVIIAYMVMNRRGEQTNVRGPVDASGAAGFLSAIIGGLTGGAGGALTGDIVAKKDAVASAGSGGE